MSAQASATNSDSLETAAKPTENETSTQHIIRSDRAFGWRDKIGYAFGDLGNCFILGLVNSFLMIYYTNVLGIAGATVGLLFLLARFIDAFADITVGRLTDTSKLTSEGRFRPWIRKMKYPFLAGAILLFVPIVNQFPMGVKMVYIFFTYIFYGIFQSAINIPYGSMASAISADPNDRTSLSTFRSIGSALGGGLTGFFIPIFMYATTDSGKRIVSGNHFFIIALVCAGLAYVSYLFTYHLSYERVQVEKTKPVKLTTVLKGIGKNRALIALVFADVLLVINQILAGTTTTYLFNDYFRSPAAMSVAMLFTYATVILLAPFATYLTNHFGKKEASVTALFIATGLYLIMFFMHTHNEWLFLAMLFIATLGAGLFNLMVWAFITDVIDYHQVVTGLREDGTVYGLNSFARKCGQALAGGIGGIMLSVIGYKASAAGGVAQSAAVVNRIYGLATLLPAVCVGVAAVILLLWYPLTKSKTQENTKILKERDAKEAD
ncbi:putative membrane spanning protein [Furfurilactobacillus rossiae]|uniref:MFS transporter n=1 Tax=Furfurilactobacillus rossiae TaxID=231049 RepID=UPI0015B90714|nr:MFS transporter [Furfurilactobacillus rossiae]QLE63133.1 putative membrane spanning protein [Furfurilactobacillus rossiae]